MSEPCSCPAAGYCERHKRLKSERHFELCRTREDYRKLWDEQAKSRGNFCGAWRHLGGDVYACSQCGRQALAGALDLLPTDRECRPTVQAETAAQTTGGCSTCGGAAPPPMAEQAKNFLSFVGDWLEEPGLAPKEEIQLDAAACDDCRFRTGGVCSVCGCSLKIKLRLEAANCPIGNWRRDQRHWKPLVQTKWLMNTLVVIPACGQYELTHACVADCRREPVRVLVVDNQGDYPAKQNELVLRSSENLGWAAACNAGIEHGLVDKSVERVVLLNNDTRLSEGFFAALIVAEAASGASIVHASMNADHESHRTRDGYNGPAYAYAPKPYFKEAGFCEGTAVSISREVLEKCGPLDASASPEHAKNVLVDLYIRAQGLGLTAAVTEAAYCEHFGVQTA